MAEIKDMLGYGPENGLTLNDLAVMTGKGKRAIRKYMENALLEGEHIVNLQDGCGYFYTEDPEILLHFYRQERARASALLVKLTHIENELKDMGLLA